MHYLENAPLGFNRNIIQLSTPDKKSKNMLPIMKQKIIQFPDVNNVALSSGNPIIGGVIARYNLDMDNDKFYTPYLLGGDDDFIKTLDLKLVEGEFPSERNDGKLVNQTLVRQFNRQTSAWYK